MRAVLGLVAFMVGAALLTCLHLLPLPVPAEEARELWVARYGGVTCSERGECSTSEIVRVRKGDVGRSSPGRPIWYQGRRVKVSVVYCFDRAKVFGRRVAPGDGGIRWERKGVAVPECHIFYRLRGGETAWAPA